MSEQNETEDTIGDVQSQTRGAELREGTRIDRYQILGLLGKGGMGAVYKAYDPELDRSIAIKILTVTPEEGETASRPQARLMREAQALAKLSHPNVVSVFDVGTCEEGIYIAMEYVKGKTLREWLCDQQPSQKEILRIWSKAGKGLHAAHTEGIVHRDYKPDNVIMGDRGQVKVLDFGLARAAGTQDAAVPHRVIEFTEDSTSGEKLLSKPLTRVGAIIGTTVYMAPEHFQFQELDEKTDQFSFCVSLFEALYGKRPFSGKTSEELEKNICGGRIEVPQEANVPKWIEELVRKGLSVSKEDRYGSMLEMLGALADDPDIAKARRRKKVQLASLILMLSAMTLGFGYYAVFKSSQVCTGAEKKIAGVWNEERKEKIRQSFVKTRVSYARDSFIRVEKLFGAYLNKWASVYTHTCEATRVTGEQSEETMDLRIGCLNKHFRNASALIRLFEDGDKTIVEKSVQALSSLSDSSGCDDIDYLQPRLAPPKDEQTKKRVDAIGEKLSEVWALSKTGKYLAGLEQSQELEAEAKKVGYPPMYAEVLYQLGEFYNKVGKYEQAEATLLDAAREAGESRNVVLATKAMSLLVGVLGYKQERHEEGLLLGRATEVMIHGMGGNERSRGLLLNSMGLVYWRKAANEKAIECLQESLAIAQKMLGPDHFSLAIRLNNLGNVYWKMGELDRALQKYSKALEINEKALGPEHPRVAELIYNIGFVFLSRRNFDKALEHYRKAQPLLEKSLGSDSFQVAQLIHNIGYVLEKKEEYDKAMEHYRKSKLMIEKLFGRESRFLAEALSRIGILLTRQNKPMKALEHFERIFIICKKKKCSTEPHGRAIFAMARTMFAASRDKHRAIKLAAQARDIYRTTPKRLKKELEEVDAWLEQHDPGKTKANNISTAKR